MGRVVILGVGVGGVNTKLSTISVEPYCVTVGIRFEVSGGEGI